MQHVVASRGLERRPNCGCWNWMPLPRIHRGVSGVHRATRKAFDWAERAGVQDWCSHVVTGRPRRKKQSWLATLQSYRLARLRVGETDRRHGVTEREASLGEKMDEVGRRVSEALRREWVATMG